MSRSTRDPFDSEFDEAVFVGSDSEVNQLFQTETDEESNKKYCAQRALENEALLAQKTVAKKTQQNASFYLALNNLCKELIKLASKHLDNPAHPAWKELLKKLFDEETLETALEAIEHTQNLQVKEKVLGLLKNYHQQFSAAVINYAEDTDHNVGIAGALRRSLQLESASLRGYQASISLAYKKLDSPMISGFLKNQTNPESNPLLVVCAVIRSLFTRGFTKTFTDLGNVKKNQGSFMFFGTSSQKLLDQHRKNGKVCDSKVTVYKTIKV